MNTIVKSIAFAAAGVLLSASLSASDYISLTGTSTYVQGFNSIGGEGVTPIPDGDGKTAYSPGSDLPDGWKVVFTTSARTNGTYEGASGTTMYIGGTSLAANDKNGTWNFGATGSTDRAVGGITTNASGGARTINVMVCLHNDAGVAFKSLAISYDIEKYRYGALASGFTIQLYTSSDGSSWISAGSDFTTVYTKDDATTGAAVVPINTQNVSGAFNVSFPVDGDLYLLWSISSTSGDAANNAQAFGIDNVSITPSISHIPPTYAVFVSDNGTITENFDCLGGSDADPSGDEKTGVSRASTLPTGWKIERNMNNPRELNSFGEASNTTMYIGGQSLINTAYNGTWNFGATGSTDRALGGLSTGSVGGSAGTRCVNVMACLYNDSRADIESIKLEYDIEKYRNGSNDEGFTVQLYTSNDGDSWTNAGASFYSAFAKDGNTSGFAIVPASIMHVSDDLSVSFPAESVVYLAWNISVSNGSTCSQAQALAIDNVTIKPAPSARTAPDGWASFSSDKALKAPEGVTVYKAVYQISGEEETLEVAEVASRVIPANTGVLLSGSNSALIKDFETATSDEVAAVESEYSDNSLFASVEKTYLSDDPSKDYFTMRYAESLGTFFQLYTGEYIPAGKAYLSLDKEGASPAPSRAIRLVVRPHIPTGAESDTQSAIRCEKVFIDGRLLIRRGDAVYTVQGIRMQ